MAAQSSKTTTNSLKTTVTTPTSKTTTTISTATSSSTTGVTPTITATMTTKSNSKTETATVVVPGTQKSSASGIPSLGSSDVITLPAYFLEGYLIILLLTFTIMYEL
ncbi:12680_t:CDS:2 [Ambispora gerdemannii]|uniref:12680_t:CDS:1 n=1 Tax=Ambispora gerdemannii TaxID=144530 RepID=A0A9N8ZVX6_9GLOM|nr:12680_t:CDS:2 [Ambispora gerdemannii]